MELFTVAIERALQKQYPKGSELENQLVIAKIFNPYGLGTWYLLNQDPDDPDYLWAIVRLFALEIGSVSKRELETLRIPPYGLPLERDLYFKPINAQQAWDRLIQGEQL